MLVVGENGVGKTNLLESLHVGTQGFSPRTRADAQLIRFGATAARILVRGRHGEVPLQLELALEAGAVKRIVWNHSRVSVSAGVAGGSLLSSGVGHDGVDGAYAFQVLPALAGSAPSPRSSRGEGRDEGAPATSRMCG